ncbi:hypothetical protein EU528_10450 [Candidatus Thorarchaeota archaeon]|nr:MAG: hypothetical protein EU528_10450 [Candidatus Thorarchaeota archaeon]
MVKGNILGTRPETDPFEDTPGSSWSITSDTELRWDDRKKRMALAQPLFLVSIAIVIGFYSPLILFSCSVLILLTIILLPVLSKELEKRSQEGSVWKEVQLTDTSCSLSDDKKYLQCKTPTGQRHLVNMTLTNVESVLMGDVSALVRAVDDSIGFTLIVTMRPENIQRALDEERIPDGLEKYFNYLKKGRMNAYVLKRGGIWLNHVNVVGHVQDETGVMNFDSAVRAAIPLDKWKRANPKDLQSRLHQLNVNGQSAWFYASGEDLANWLVQLKSELASEVGSNIPGQFLAPIRGRPSDYRLGVTINPDTLQTGPTVGISHSELETGTLLCGGTTSSRTRVLALLTSELLRAGKRVVIITNNPDSIGLTRLSEGSVHLELGRDLVLNPVDAEGIHRSEFVPLVISSLEAVAAADLRGAADLEAAIGRAVTLGNATLADVHIPNGLDDSMAGPTDVQQPPEQLPSKKSMTGMEAIRSLYEGSAAKSFYGTQTVPTSRLVEPNLSVVRIALGSTGLEHFAWNIMSIKIAGLRPDPNLVVILDGAENFRVRNRRYMQHDSFTEQVLKKLKQRGPLVVALEHPVDMAPGAIATLESCISLRLRESVDIKIAADLLGLNVITTGMHTKARISPRESSFLRIMDNDTALLVHDGMETCQPVRLDPAPDLSPETITSEETRRVSTLIDSGTSSTTHHEGSLLDRVSAGSTNLAIRVLKLLERYEPLTEEAVRRFIVSSGSDNNPDVEAILARLEHASMILKGHEVHSGVSYTNYRITMKGSMALRQTDGLEGATA